jgi:hypothetical protein
MECSLDKFAETGDNLGADSECGNPIRENDILDSQGAGHRYDRVDT